jgi:MFS transporter, ACDE family, multidrug resistance protein
VTSSSPPANPSLLRDPNLQIIFGITLAAIMGVSSITPAFPRIIVALQITPQQVGLLITFFTLPGILLTPVLGVMADRIGRKRILVPSLLLFGLAGSACALAHSFPLLLGLRFLQGVGAAALGAINVTLIGDLYTGKQRAAAMGYNASALSIGTASYPVVGGALATLSWNFPFLLPLLALPLALVILRMLKNPEPPRDQLFRSYITDAWKSVSRREVIGLFALSMLTFVILYGSFLTYFPILIDQRFGGSTFVIGLLMASMSLTTAFTASQLGRLSRRFGRRHLLMTAYGMLAAGMLIIPLMTSLWMLLLGTLVFGIGHGMNMPIILTLLADLAPTEQRAATMALNGMVLRIGQTLGPLVTGAVFVLWGIDGAILTGAVVALLLPVVMLLAGVGATSETTR